MLPLVKCASPKYEQSLQQFVSQSPWAWEPLWQRMAERVERTFPQPAARLLDDTGFPKKGEHSVGVARRYSGTLGKHAGQFAAGFPPVLDYLNSIAPKPIRR